MTRRKIWCCSWTLVLILVIISPLANSRPSNNEFNLSTVQSVTSTSSAVPTRYINKLNTVLLALKNFLSSLHNSNFTNTKINNVVVPHKTNSIENGSTNNAKIFAPFQKVTEGKNFLSIFPETRKSRKNSKSSTTKQINHKRNEIKTKSTIPLSQRDTMLKWKLKNTYSDKTYDTKSHKPKRKPVIKKLITKWRDKAKLEDITYNPILGSLESSVDESSTEKQNIDSSSDISYTSTVSLGELSNKQYQPNHYSHEMHVYSNTFNIIDDTNNFPHPIKNPSPRPIITNSGNPNVWNSDYANEQIVTKLPDTNTQQHHTHSYDNNENNNYRPLIESGYFQTQTTIKPTKLGIKTTHSTPTVSHYQHTPYLEVSTSGPVSSYTDRIVIRPEEYNASPDDCPTIFLSLNNTFQGQGKEACPDVNIAVNTNVINKNVVISEEDEEEDDTDPYLSEAFGLPGEESEENSVNNDYYDSSDDISQTTTDTIKNDQLDTLSGNNANIENFDDPSGYIGTASNPAALATRPHRPLKDDDDNLGLGSLGEWIRPAVNAMGWFATFNPLSFGVLTLVLAPIVIAMAGTTGLAAFFAPWALPYGRQSPKVVHVYRPQWKWHDDDKTWGWHNFPDNRKWRQRYPKRRR